jgi:hypothetical protein
VYIPPSNGVALFPPRKVLVDSQLRKNTLGSSTGGQVDRKWGIAVGVGKLT